ncbi:hypothetical protein [Kocuria sp. CCUG 69068]|uniref:hypothetical protein n=1 Tax=Kocuria sp. CCUG 69068 TaxID=2043138 RepID=UPI001E3239C6
MSTPSRKAPKYTTLYDPNQPGRSRTVPEADAKAWKAAGWTESPAPAKDPDTDAKSS